MGDFLLGAVFGWLARGVSFPVVIPSIPVGASHQRRAIEVAKRQEQWARGAMRHGDDFIGVYFGKVHYWGESRIPKVRQW